MKDEGHIDRERVQALMMAAVDGEISDADRRELDAIMSSAPDVAQEWQRFARLKEVTTGMSLRKPPEEVWDRYWQSTYSRTERRVAWVLISLGAIIIVAFAGWNALGEFLQDTTTPLSMRIAIASLLLGGILLAVSVIREKVFTNRRDPYQKEIIR